MPRACKQPVRELFKYPVVFIFHFNGSSLAIRYPAFLMSSSSHLLLKSIFLSYQLLLYSETIDSLQNTSEFRTLFLQIQRDNTSHAQIKSKIWYNCSENTYLQQKVLSYKDLCSCKNIAKFGFIKRFGKLTFRA